MIGNDIIDLEEAKRQSNWKRDKWLQKIFTDKERFHITQSEQPEQLVWQFWSMKEATYKAHQRRFKLQPMFNPKSFECDLKNRVICREHSYLTKTRITDSFIYSTAKVSELRVISKILQKPNSTRFELKELLSKKYQTKPSFIHIEKDFNQVPQIRIKEELKQIDFSFTHHGNFSAFIIVL